MALRDRCMAFVMLDEENRPMGQAFTTIGTSAVVYSHLDHYTAIPDGGLHLCCCAVPGCYHTMGGPQSAGLSLEWFKEKFCQDLIRQAAEEGTNIHTVGLRPVY